MHAQMTENQLNLNDDKTEALLFPFSSSLRPSTVSLPDPITLGSHNIPFSDSARNLGVILDSYLSMKKHVTKIGQTAYFELKRISSIRRFLTEAATKTLVSCYILSRLDYCNCLLMGSKSSNTNARVMAFVLSLALDPTFGIHSHKTLDTAQPCHLFKAKLKTFLFSQYFHTN